jgi:PAS domain S-box-containing protein
VLEARPADVRIQEHLLDYLDNAVVGLHWVDSDGTILWANAADYEPLGYTREEYLGHRIAEFHADADVISDITGRLLRGESLYNYPAALLRKDGSIERVLIAANGLFQGEHFIHSRCFTIRDPRSR